jgi:hypothetical protein
MEGQTHEVHMIIGLGIHPYSKFPSLLPVRTKNSSSFNNVDNVLVCAPRCSLIPAGIFCAPEGIGLSSNINRILSLKCKNVHALSNCVHINLSLG